MEGKDEDIVEDIHVDFIVNNGSYKTFCEGLEEPIERTRIEISDDEIYYEIHDLDNHDLKNNDEHNYETTHDINEKDSINYEEESICSEKDLRDKIIRDVFQSEGEKRIIAELISELIGIVESDKAEETKNEKITKMPTSNA